MKQILLIEDNEDHAELIHRALLQGFGAAHVDFANTAHDAYEILEKRSFDLILCDYYLPDIKREAHIRQLSKLAPGVPIVVITGQGDEKVAARSIKAGAEDYIVKTRESLAALPSILKRAMTKHHTHQNKKQKEIKKHLRLQKVTIKKLLTQVESIGKKVRTLKKQTKNTKRKPAKSKTFTAIEHLTQQINSLKDFVRKTLLGGK